MIKVFNASDTVFTSGGNKTLFPVSCVEKKVTSEDWNIEVELPMSSISFVEQDSIVVVPTKYGSQPFRVSNLSAKRSIEFTAYHIGFDSKNFIIDYLVTDGLTAQNCLNALIGATTDSNHFTSYSDIADTKTLTFSKCSLYDALLAVQEAYGGYIDFNGWQIRLTSTLGADRGLEFRKGKNLKSTEIHEDWGNVCTTVLPMGTGDITLTPKTRSSATVYDRPYTKVVEFNTSDLTELETMALDHLDKNSLPKINYKVEAVVTDNLANTYAYLEGFTYGELETYTYGELETPSELFYQLNDTVVVKSDLFSITANILAYTYNILTQRTKSIEFGNYIRTVRRAFSAINESIEEVKNRTNELRTITALQTELINNAGTYGYCTRTSNETYYHDTIPLADSVNVMRMNSAGIGFSHTGPNGPFISAWTLDSKFNANFIQAGILSAIEINNGSGTFRVLPDGSLTALNATITGAITATSGKIGRLDINANQDIYYESDLFACQYDETDVTRLRQILAGIITATAYDNYVYDINGSGGALTITDLVQLRLVVAGSQANPNRMIRSRITIGKTYGEINVTSVDTNGNVGGSFVMQAGKIIGKQSNIDYLQSKQLTFGNNGLSTGVVTTNSMTYYEEGTFTPIIKGSTSAGTGTYTTQQGVYKRSGNRVEFDIYLVWTAHTGTGNMLIGGLPYSASFVSIPKFYNNGVALTASNYMNGYVSGTDIAIQQQAITNSVITNVTMDTNAALIVSGSYQV